MKIVDLAKAIAPGCRHEMVGVRPGEKIHETLISEEEARNTIEFKECYIINSHMQSHSVSSTYINGKGQPCPAGFKYASDTNSEWLSVEDLRQLIEQISDDYAIEKSRWSMEDVPQ
jgi:UDP-N-acetylglucosamine 4,6-dehydratase